MCVLFICDEQPVPRQEHNGEGFHYRVGYRPLRAGGQMYISEVRNPNNRELIVYDVPVFEKYEVIVQSVNNIGEAPILGGERKMGYSGEGRKCGALSLFIYFTITHANYVGRRG